MKKIRLLAILSCLLLSTTVTPMAYQAESSTNPVFEPSSNVFVPLSEDTNPTEPNTTPIETVVPTDENMTQLPSSETVPMQEELISAYPSTDWTAYFYNNIKFAGGYKYKKNLVAGKSNLLVYQNYSNGSPHSSIVKDGFSAKIQGTFTIMPGTYILRLQHEDAAKILVDGKVVLDNWKKGSTREDAVKITIESKNSSATGNQHVIQIQYADISGSSFFKFLIEPYEEAQKTNGWIGEVFNTTNFTGQSYIIGGDQARSKINTLNLNWTNKTPHHLITGNKYSSRWYTYQYIKKGTYNISTKGNDNIAVYFNNQRIINQSGTNSATGSFTVDTDGYYFIRVEHIEKDGKKNGKLELLLPFVQLTTDEIAYNWGAGSPSSTIPVDNFVANITTHVTIGNGDYFVPSVSLGGVTTSLGEQKNIIEAVGNGTQLKTGLLLNQTAGTYPLNVSYHAGTGNAGIFTQVVPFDRWSAFIYPTASVYNLPKVQTTVVESSSYALDYQLGSKAPANGISANNYAVRFINYKHLEAGTYTVKAASKAGAFSVYIDGKKALTSGSSIKTTASSDTATFTIANDTNAAMGDIHEIMITFQKRTGTTSLVFDIEKIVEDSTPPVTENGYQTLDLRKPAPSTFTTQVMDEYLKGQTRYASSPFIGQTQLFLDAQAKYGVNALFLFSLAVHEGVAATSDIGRAKNNSFGLGAYDNCPFDCAQYFPTLADSVNYQAFMLKRNYLTTGGLYANGPYLGDKSGGLNVRYATDPLWGQKTANIMQKIIPYDSFHYSFASPIVDNGANPGNDFIYKYPSNIKGVVTANSLNVRKTPDTNYTAIGTLDKKTIVDVKGRHNNNYFQISYAGTTGYVSQNPNSPYVKLLNLGRVAPSNGAATLKLWKNLDPNSDEFYETIKRTAYVELVLDGKNKPVIDTNTLGTWYKVKSSKGNVGWLKKTDVTQVFAASSSDLP